MYNVQDHIVVYYNSVLPIICESWYFTHMWKALVWPDHFNKRGCLGPQNELNPATFFIEVSSKERKSNICICVRGFDFISFYDFSIAFYDSVVFYACFALYCKTTLRKKVDCYFTNRVQL